MARFMIDVEIRTLAARLRAEIEASSGFEYDPNIDDVLALAEAVLDYEQRLEALKAQVEAARKIIDGLPEDYL